MRPVTGDLLLLKDVDTGLTVRGGQVLDTRGDEARPVYVVRWSDTGEVEMYIADETAYIHHVERAGVDEFSLATGFGSTPPEGSHEA